MDFMQSETRINLARAFAGESQARNRYTIYADIARKEGQEYLARIFQETADNEKVHGEEFLEMIQKHAPAPQENIHIDAGYPFPLGSTAQNLAFAAAGELEEFTTAYPAFAELAKREGFQDVARLFEQIATIEQTGFGCLQRFSGTECGNRRNPVPEASAHSLALSQLWL